MNYQRSLRRQATPDFLRIAIRRRYHLLLPIFALSAAAAWIALRLPDVYRSTATVMIQDDMPAYIVSDAVASFAIQRLEVIRKRVLTTSNASAIARKYGLYGSTAATPATVLAQRFNSDVRLDLISADAIDPQSGRTGRTAIAFTLSFDSNDPAAAQQIVGELVQLFLEENVRSGTNRAEDVVDLLEVEASRLETELLQLEAELAAFKAEHEGAMPELYDVNVAAHDRAEQELTTTNGRIAELEKRRFELLANLSQVQPDAPIVLPNGSVLMGDRQRLESLLSEQRRLKGTYGEAHPTLARLAREIENLRSSLGMEADSPLVLGAQLEQAENELAALRERYSEEHPEVRRAAAVVDSLRSQLDAVDADVESVTMPTNPAYLVVSTQLRNIEIELSGANQRRADLERRIAYYQELIRRAPEVERRHQALVRDHATATAKYQELRAKQQEAEIARNVAAMTQANRLTLLEPPALPLAPYAPDRNVIVLLGLILGVSVGVATAAAFEILDKRIYGATSLTGLTGSRPLAVVPYIETGAELHARKLRRTIAGALSALGLIAAATYVFAS